MDYIQHLMIGWAGQWTQIPSTTTLQPKKWNAHFWITFNFWWLVRQVDRFKPHLPALSSQKNEILLFGFHSTSDDQPGRSINWKPICHLSPGKNENAYFWITYNFRCSAGLVNGLELHPTPLCSQKHEMHISGLLSTSDDWLGCSMDSNPIHHHSPGKKMKCSFLDYIQLLMISLAGKWTQTTSATPLQPKNEMLIFGLCSTSDDWHGWLMDSNPICHQSPPKVMKCSFLDYIQLLIISLAGQWTWTTSTTSLLLKEWNTHFWITFKFLWLAGQVDGLKPHLPPVSSQKNEMLHFWITFKLLMINWDGQWIWIMSTTSL